MTKFEKFPKDGYSYSAADVGAALAGLIQRSAGVPRVGMLVAPTVAAVAASWKVEVGPFWYVHQVNGAVSFSGLSAGEQVDIGPATTIPSGQSRIDRVCWDQVAEELVVVQGVAAVSPAVPSIGSKAPVARVLVQAGDGMVVGSRVTREFVTTGLVTSGDDTGWIEASGMAQVSGAPKVKYRMQDGVVEITGRGRKTAGTYAMFQLPEAMRFASGAMRFAAEAGMDIEVTANGWVSCTNRNAVDVTFNIRYVRA